MPVLTANLAELAWPVREDCRLRGVVDSGKTEPVGLIDTDTGKPAAGELIIARGVVAEGFVQTERLLAMMPHQLGASNERVINRPAERFPAYRGIQSIN